VFPVSYELGSYNSVFVFSLRAAFDCVFNLKTLKVHNMFRSLRPSSGVKILDRGYPRRRRSS
jgi:hypothetical protein